MNDPVVLPNDTVALPCALTVAGSDSGGGAGIQADLKTFAALRVFGTSALTAVTAQNTTGVTAFEPISPALVTAQIEAVLSDLPVRAIKTGMLANAEVAAAVADALAGRDLPLVVDPVLVATSGDRLLDDDGARVLIDRLTPMATLVTPNLPEAEALTGATVRTLEQQRTAARAIVELGAKAALVKGGHADGDPIDVFADGEHVVELRASRIDTTSTHGTGCTLSAAVCARLAAGDEMLDAVRAAHAYLHEAIRTAPGLGEGHGPLHHLHPFYASGREAGPKTT